MSDPCTQGHECVWLRDVGTAYKCTFATCKVYVIDDEQGTYLKDTITGVKTRISETLHQRSVKE